MTTLTLQCQSRTELLLYNNVITVPTDGNSRHNARVSFLWWYDINQNDITALQQLFYERVLRKFILIEMTELAQ